MRQSFFLVSGLILLAIGLGIPELLLWGWWVGSATCAGDCLLGLGLGLFYSNILILPCIGVGTVLALHGRRREQTTPTRLSWPAVLSLCVSALSIAIRVALLSHIPLPYPIAIYGTIVPFLPLSSALAAAYLTDRVPWGRARLLSAIALVSGSIALMLGVIALGEPAPF